MRIVRRILRNTNAFYFVTAAVAAIFTLHPELSVTERVVLLLSSVPVVLVHELGHAGTALATGRRLRGLVVTPFWGCTTLGGPRYTLGWLVIVLAGPIAAILFAAAFLFVPVEAIGLGAAAVSALQVVALVSVFESAANLLPFGQLDGRKVYDMFRGSRCRVIECADLVAAPEAATADLGKIVWTEPPSGAHEPAAAVEPAVAVETPAGQENEPAQAPAVHGPEWALEYINGAMPRPESSAPSSD